MIHTSTPNEFSDHVVHIPAAQRFCVWGYQTEAECRAWFRGESTLFDAFDEWLEDEPVGRVVGHRSDGSGSYRIAFDSVVDAVHFKLRWANRIP